jgi:hypothetical protein
MIRIPLSADVRDATVLLPLTNNFTLPVLRSCNLRFINIDYVDGLMIYFF